MRLDIWEVLEVRFTWLSLAVTYRISYVPRGGDGGSALSLAIKDARMN
jgi:hypothetical protein